MLKMLKKLSHEEREAINILECNSGTARHTVQRIFCHMELDVDLVRQTLVETTQQRASTTQIDTVLDDVGIKLRGGVLQCRQYGILDLCHRLVETMGYLLIAYGHLHGQSRDAVGAMHHIVLGSLVAKVVSAEPTCIFIRSAIRSLTFTLC